MGILSGGEVVLENRRRLAGQLLRRIGAAPCLTGDVTFETAVVATVLMITLTKTGEATTDLLSRMRKYLTTFGC